MTARSTGRAAAPHLGDRVPGWTPDIGARMAIIIERSGGLKAAAELLRTKAETVASWRDGKTRAPLFSVKVLSEKSGVTLDWLVTGEEGAPLSGGSMPSASASVDAEFMGQVIEMVDLAYRDFGSRPSSRELGQVAARIYAKAISVGADPAERVGALKVLVSDAREELLRKMNKMDEQHGR